MFRELAFASATALFCAAGLAQAQDPGPRLVGGGDNAEVVYAEPSRNVVGGAVAAIAGGGDNLQVTYGPRVTVGASTGLAAELVGGGDNAQVVYREVASPDWMVATHRASRRSGG